MKQGQMEMPAAVLVVLLIMLLILAPITLKIITAITSQFGSAMETSAPGANATMTAVVNTTNNFWDIGMIIAFIVICAFMFISAYFVDISPMFVIIYVILGFFLFLLIPGLQDAMTGIYGAMPDETLNLTMTDYLRSHFSIVVFAMYIITGIIMAAKLKNSQGGVQ